MSIMGSTYDDWLEDDERETFVPKYRCLICGVGYNSQREADLCTPMKWWDRIYGADAFLHPNNNWDEMWQWKDPDN